MTEQKYKEKRAHLVDVVLSINKRFFPRCFKARVQEIAKLDAEYNGRDFEEVKNELMIDF